LQQIAVFVDAGYLFAQGSALLAGSKAPRSHTRLNAPIVIAELGSLARAVEPNARLLRIYWYDGLSRGSEVSFDQRTIAESENVKCRFGTINSRGEQKGVDSLIVTDMIELARSGAISDALVVSGDEDIRVGVQVAQTFGIRVHLLGIQPARGSQSPDLRAESDTLHEWGNGQVETWLQIVPPDSQEPNVEATVDWFARSVADALEKIDPVEARRLVDFAALNGNALPQDFDRPTLARAGDYAGRKLDADERKRLRNAVRDALRERSMATD
jgi:uncharacterized LabA/DUF88 family protein